MIEEHLDEMVRYAVLWSQDSDPLGNFMEAKDDRNFIGWVLLNDIPHRWEFLSKRRSILYVPEDKVELLNKQRKQISVKNYVQRALDYISE